VNNSSAQNTFSVTLDNTVNMSTSSGVVTITSEPYDYMISGDTITLDFGDHNPAQTITLTGAADTTLNIDDSIFTNIFITNVPFENSFPEWYDFQNMCREYPGLEQAYEKLKTFYDLCKDEWEHKKKATK